MCRCKHERIIAFSHLAINSEEHYKSQRVLNKLIHETHLTTSQVNWLRQTDREQTDCEPTVSLQWYRHSDFVTKWGLGQDGSGDSKNIFRIALLSQSALFAVSLFAVSLSVVSLSRSVVVDPLTTSAKKLTHYQSEINKPNSELTNATSNICSTILYFVQLKFSWCIGIFPQADNIVLISNFVILLRIVRNSSIISKLDVLFKI